MFRLTQMNCIFCPLSDEEFALSSPDAFCFAESLLKDFIRRDNNITIPNDNLYNVWKKQSNIFHYIKRSQNSSGFFDSPSEQEIHEHYRRAFPAAQGGFKKLLSDIRICTQCGRKQDRTSNENIFSLLALRQNKVSCFDVLTLGKVRKRLKMSGKKSIDFASFFHDQIGFEACLLRVLGMILQLRWTYVVRFLLCSVLMPKLLVDQCYKILVRLAHENESDSDNVFDIIEDSHRLIRYEERKITLCIATPWRRSRLPANWPGHCYVQCSCDARAIRAHIHFYPGDDLVYSLIYRSELNRKFFPPEMSYGDRRGFSLTFIPRTLEKDRLRALKTLQRLEEAKYLSAFADARFLIYDYYGYI